MLNQLHHFLPASILLTKAVLHPQGSPLSQGTSSPQGSPPKSGNPPQCPSVLLHLDAVFHSSGCPPPSIPYLLPNFTPTQSILGIEKKKKNKLLDLLPLAGCLSGSYYSLQPQAEDLPAGKFPWYEC